MARDPTVRDPAQTSTVETAGNRRWLLPLLIGIFALALRLIPLQRYVTPDEPAWVYRSIRFSQALAAGDVAAVPTTGHPGVTTMWLGGIGLQIHRWLSPDEAAVHLEWLDGLAGLSPQSAAAYHHLAFFLPAGRILVALVTSLGLVSMFALVSRLWGARVAFLAVILLVLDPFLVGHSGLLHLDGMLTTAMTLSALTALLAIRPYRTYRWITLSGLLGGLSLLTKTPGAFMALFVGLLLLAAWLTHRISWRQALVSLSLWGLVAGLAFLILYPAVWADPIHTLRSLLEVGGRHVEGAIRPIFFRGQLTFDADASFYLFVWLFRTSPLVLLGLPVAIIVHLRHTGSRRFAIVALVTLALGFGLFITLVGKKHDRYLLPAFPSLTLVAGLGWDEVSKFIGRKLEGWAAFPSFLLPNILIAVVLLVQFLLLLPFRSAPLGYFNPLLGGPRTAVRWLEIGWGEGFGAAARWLNRHPRAEELIVATPSIPLLASYFVGQTVQLDEKTQEHADYIVYPALQGTEQESFGATSATPVYESQVGGVSYARVIENAIVRQQAAYLNDYARGDDLILLDADAALAHEYGGPAELAVLADVRDPVQLAARLGSLLSGHERLWHVALPAASPITAHHVQNQLLCRSQTVSTVAVAGTSIRLLDLNPISGSATCDETRITPYTARFGDSLALVDGFLPRESIAWPDHLSLVVRWAAQASLRADYRAILFLKDEAGRTWVEGGQEIVDADYRRPSTWAVDHWSDQTFILALPPAIPPGSYTVEMGVFDPFSGTRLGVWDSSDQFVGLSFELGNVVIAQPPSPPTPWDVVIAMRRDPPVAAGPLLLWGQNPPAAQIPSGDRTGFDLFWQAATPPGVDFSIRWRLVSLEAEAVLTETFPLAPYPTSHWRADELVQVRYDLPIAPDLPAGDYALHVNVVYEDGSLVWPEDLVLSPVKVLARDRLFSLPSDIAYPLDVRLGSRAHLRGFDLDRMLATPEEQLSLTLYWQADGPTDESYTVFVHLVGPDGLNHGQVDRPPANGAAPTHSWAAGQVVVDQLSLPILSDAAPGVYHIAVGLYNPDNGQRLPVFDATGLELPNDQILLPVEVVVQ